jgi:hypothetical protein
MKKALVASILGLVATAASSFGQGAVFFSTYVGTVYQPITYVAPLPAGATAGQTVGAGFKAVLYYGFGADLAFSALSPVPDSLRDVGTQAPGYVTGGIVSIPGYTAGPVTFAVVAFDGADWAGTLADLGNGVATLPENVRTWTEASIAANPNPAGLFQQNVPPVTVSLVVPEPSSFALFGLGAAGLALFRRRRQ